MQAPVEKISLPANNGILFPQQSAPQVSTRVKKWTPVKFGLYSFYHLLFELQCNLSLIAFMFSCLLRYINLHIIAL